MADAGGAVIVPDAELTAARITELVIPMLRDPKRLAAMSTAARGTGHRDAAITLARIVLEVCKK